LLAFWSEVTCVLDIVINATSRETRVALLEQAVMTEIFIERPQERGIVGNIYKGSVTRILPGIQAAFVDIGLKKAGFLYVSDVLGNQPRLEPDIPALSSDIFPPPAAPSPLSSALPLSTPQWRIEALLEEGQEILVQVAKEPLGTKGCRLTSHLTLPGRYLVLIPGVAHIGISRRIVSEEEKLRLRQLVHPLLPPNMGCIMRTLSAGASMADLQADIQFLQALWQDVQRKATQALVPQLVHQELDLPLRALRDLLSDNVERCLIDDLATYTRAETFVQTYFPHLVSKIMLYQGSGALFESLDIERQFEQALHSKVRLKSGGYITIDHTEALVAIDVNTGQYTNNHDPDETILITNLEAVEEVARQLRLRNLGGLIIIDFIDMERPDHQAKVMQRLEACLQHDRARTKVLHISEFGLVEMTRQRVRASLGHLLQEPCPCCGGTGVVETTATVCAKIFREIQRVTRIVPHTGTVTIHVHPAVAARLHNEEKTYVSELEEHLRIHLTVKANDGLRRGQFNILPF
jgi:ribonuclease G